MQIMELQHKFQEADSRVQLLEQTETHLRSSLSQKETALAVRLLTPSVIAVRVKSLLDLKCAGGSSQLIQ